MTRLYVLLGVIAVAIYLLFSSIYVVNVRQQAIVMRFGQITDVKTEPGLYFKLPTTIVDSVQFVEDRLLRYDIANMTVQVKGGKFYQVDAFLTYRISNPRLFRQVALGELRVAEDRIATRFTAALRQVYGLREFDAALSAERSAMMREARDLIAPDMKELGIDIVDVRILRTDLTQEVSSQTFERMKAERLAEAAFLRARGQEAAQSLKAIADRQKIEIVAAAQKEAEILRGEGEAARSAIFAAAYGQDPEFFEFYRTMQSYRTALDASGTTMLLSPDSEFFRYFNGSTLSGTVPPPAAPGGITLPTPEALGVDTTEDTVPDGMFAPTTTTVDSTAQALKSSEPPSTEPVPAPAQ